MDLRKYKLRGTSLTQNWPVINGLGASMDVSNVVELPTLTSLEPEQDLSRDTREIILSPWIVEKNGRGTFIKKRSDLRHILDYQAELE
jgi:hypothetical protein